MAAPKYKPSTARLKGGAKTYWASYDSKQRYRGGVVHARKRVKRFYVSGQVVSIGRRVGNYKNKAGNITKGIKVEYINHVKAFTAKRGKTSYKQPAKKIAVRKIIPLDHARLGQQVAIHTKKPTAALDID